MKEKITKLFHDFTRSEKNSGLVLIFCTIISLILANSVFSSTYIHFWHQNLKVSFPYFELDYSFHHWINDGLMTIFFLLVGLEIERELYEGELHPIKNAIIPIAAAIGGMLMPALIYFLLNQNTNAVHGFGIPMATDIAFSLAVLSLAGNKVPFSVKILLTALAIIDDLGSIIVIALFYGTSIQWVYLMVSLGIFLFLLLLNRLRMHRLTPYLILGIPMWYCMMKSGIHATLSGVLLAFALPYNYHKDNNPSVKLQEILHIPVAFIILPLFTLVNTAIPLRPEFIHSLADAHSIGIALGLLLGKPLGITLSIYLLLKSKMVKVDFQLSQYYIIAMGFAAGIGFTMSIFITHLAFDNEVWVQSSKMMILLTSFVAGVISYLMFKLKKSEPNDITESSGIE